MTAGHDRADAHIHLFEGGYQGGSFATRPGVKLDEPACYESLMKEHRVAAALIVGYALEPWCAANNDYLARIRPDHSWMHPVASIDLADPPSTKKLDAWRKQGFVGVSAYVFDETHRRNLAAVNDDVWRYCIEHRWLISVNAKNENWNAWRSIVDRHGDLRLIVSHLGLPPRVVTPPADVAALKSVTDLAGYPQVRVKLSGFYALSDPGHDYPHRAAWPYVEALKQSFGVERLLWASDFSPCLDWLSFPQTIDVFGGMPFFSDADRRRIEGANLLALIAETGRP